MDTSDRAKLFVGGIAWGTSKEALFDHFNKYGEVVDSIVMTDRNTGSTRGFGFVVFAEVSAAEKALQESHVIGGRMVEVKKAVPRPEHLNGVMSNGNNGNNNSSNQNHHNDRNNSVNHAHFRTKKIFVGGLSSNLTEEEFRTYFEKFGKVTDVVVMHDNSTQRPRGFGFITFESEESVENAVEKNFHELSDKLVEVKRAVPKDGNNGHHVSNGTRSMGNKLRYTSSNGYTPMYGPFVPTYGIYPPNFTAYSPVSGFGNDRIAGFPSPYGSLYGTAGAYAGYSYEGYVGNMPQTPGRLAYANGASIGAPRSPWNGYAVPSSWQSPIHYSNSIYPYAPHMSPGYVNGGAYVPASGYSVVRAAVTYNGNGRWTQWTGDRNTKATQGVDDTHTNAIQGGDDMHTNATQETDDRNTNATQETDDRNTNATQGTDDRDTDAIQGTDDRNTNACQGTDDRNTNACQGTDDSNTHISNGEGHVSASREDDRSSDDNSSGYGSSEGANGTQTNVDSRFQHTEQIA